MRLAVPLSLVFACSAGLQEKENPDAQKSPDARPADATIDARPCTGGDTHAADSQGNCYLFFTGPKLYADAKADCEMRMAHLAKITNQEQETLVESLRTIDAFLGATDQVTEGTYLWFDGTPLTYTHWRANEPNNGNGAYQEDCMILTNTTAIGWDDRPCAPPPLNSGSYGYICQY